MGRKSVEQRMGFFKKVTCILEELGYSAMDGTTY
jgi:hypothetical protein